jgi:cellulose synthase/poly-beta-1,6-N-acetylglucosamine synthase-like glycosyltransferase
MNIAVLGVYLCMFIALYFEVFLLITFLEKRPSQKNSDRPSRYPSVAVIVPCWNEEKTLAGTVASLLALDYPQDKLQIVIVDDGSKDGTRAIGESLAAENPQVAFYHKENGGKYTALNFGIERTESELIGCLDADSFVDHDALIEMVKQFERSPDMMALTPTMKVHRPRKILELMQAVEYTFGIFYKKMFDNLSAINVIPGPFSIYKREVFERIGLFHHAHNTEDMEITFRMHANGLKIGNAHTAYVHTKVPTTPWALIKQRTRWSQGFLQNSQDYKYMYFNPRFGNFGMLILPFALIGFVVGMYMAMYMLYTVSRAIITRVLDLWATHIPPHISTAHLQWFYINTSMMTFLVCTVIGMTLVAILLGQRISKTSLSPLSIVSYFLLFGLIAPVWLARAAWGAARSQESIWR